MIEKAIETLEAATVEDFHKPRNRLNELRFYLDQIRCDRINAALDQARAQRVDDRGTGEDDCFFQGPGMDLTAIDLGEPVLSQGSISIDKASPAITGSFPRH